MEDMATRKTNEYRLKNANQTAEFAFVKEGAIDFNGLESR